MSVISSARALPCDLSDEKQTAYLLIPGPIMNSARTLDEEGYDAPLLDVKSTGTKAHLCKRIQRAEFHYSHRPTQPLFVKKLNKTQFLQIDTFQKFFSLVFENDYAIGKFDHRIETVKPLTKDDIQICKQIGVPFHIPTILEGKHQIHRIRQILDEEESDEENI